MVECVGDCTTTWCDLVARMFITFVILAIGIIMLLLSLGFNQYVRLRKLLFKVLVFIGLTSLGTLIYAVWFCIQ